MADWLTRLAGEGFPPGLRLAALAQLARCAPDALPGDVVRVVTGLLRQLRSVPVRRAEAAPEVDAQAGPAEAVAAADPHSEAAVTGEPPVEERAAPVTLVGQLRALSDEEASGRTAPWTADLLRTLHIGLDDRVAERTALLTDQLRSPDHQQRIDALRMSSGLIRAWRGSYEELVRLVGEQLATPSHGWPRPPRMCWRSSSGSPRPPPMRWRLGWRRTPEPGFRTGPAGLRGSAAR